MAANKDKAATAAILDAFMMIPSRLMYLLRFANPAFL
jgi:hypothetical protein